MNLSLIPTSIEKDTKHFILVQNMVLKREMIESQLPDIQYYPISSGKLLRRYLSLKMQKMSLKF